MKTRGKALTLAACALLSGTLALVGRSVVAGTKVDEPVTITVTTTTRTAKGSLGTARASSDVYQIIGCDINATGSQLVLTCFARDASDNGFSCRSTSPNLIQAAMSIGPSSRLYFADKLDSVCSQLEVTNWSQYRPVVP